MNSEQSYVAILRNGNVLFECISEDGEPVFANKIIGNHKINVVSMSLKKGNRSEIIIDGINHSLGICGFNIVVFDETAGTIIDSVSFNTSVADIPCFRYNDLQLSLLCKISSIHNCGYSIPQFCIENNFDNITLLFDERDWIIAEPICQTFKFNKNVTVKHMLSYKDAFCGQYVYNYRIGKECTVPVSEVILSHNDIVFVLSTIINREVEKDINKENTGGVVFYLSEFITELANITFIERPIRNFLLKNPNVYVLSFALPSVLQTQNLSENEFYIKTNSITLDKVVVGLQNGEIITKSYNDDDYSISDLLEINSVPKSYLGANGIRVFADYKSKFVNCVNGHRVTIPQKYENIKRTVYMVGGCNIFGVCNEDKDTISSNMQKLFDEICPEKGFAVVNYGFYLNGHNDEVYDLLNSIPYHDGDIFIMETPITKGVDCINLSRIFNRPHIYGEVFSDYTHFTKRGTKVIAEKLFESIKERHFYERTQYEKPRPIAPTGRMYGIPDISITNVIKGREKELTEYKQFLKQFRSESNGITGAIVMNCNPFTLGHRYLIEYASKKVDKLFIFVVEEDKSFFPFKDRIELVKIGISDINNAVVLPSGMFIISTLTFSGYFNKERLQDVIVDTSNDVYLFEEQIAPELNISVRFVGEEPLDAITRQYNKNLEDILPRYGIKLCKIQRKEYGETAISASRVRKLLKEKDFEGIKNMVPATTLEYLIKLTGKEEAT